MTDDRQDKLELPRQLSGLSPEVRKFAPPERRPSPVDEIAQRATKLTYGELKELAEGFKAEPDAVWTWAVARVKETGL